MDKEKEDIVVIDGVNYSKSKQEVLFDFITGKWALRDSNKRWMSRNLVYEIVRGRIRQKTVYTQSDSFSINIFSTSIQYDRHSPDLISRFEFENYDIFKDFCKRYNIVKGINNDKIYYFSDLLKKYDRIRPYYFNNNVYKKKPENILGNFMELKPEDKKLPEYREVEEACRMLNEKVGIESKSFISFEGLKYTFGVEMETVSGSLRDLFKIGNKMELNISSVKDGSLRDRDEDGNQIGEPWGAEYVTGVLKGDSGLKHLNEITNVLKDRCTVDKRTSVHVHIGSLKWTSEEIVYAYILGEMIQDEMFSMMPKSRRGNEYCRMLKPLKTELITKVSGMDKSIYKNIINDLYTQVFKLVSGVNSPNSDYNKKSRHPAGRHGGYNRDTDHRYSWLNFTNIIFNQRDYMDAKTIEFRCHSGTLSYNKIHKWIKICMAFVEYVHNNKRCIINALRSGKKIDLETILKSVYPKTGAKLSEYVQLRKDLFAITSNEDSDYQQSSEQLIKNFKDIICV